MRPTGVLLAAVLLLPGCLIDEPTNHATIIHRGTTPVEVHVVFTSPDGDIIRETTQNLEPGESFEFSLAHPSDGTYHLVAETEDGRSDSMNVSWQGSTGPARVRFYVYDDRIEEEQTT